MLVGCKYSSPNGKYIAYKVDQNLIGINPAFANKLAEGPAHDTFKVAFSDRFVSLKMKATTAILSKEEQPQSITNTKNQGYADNDSNPVLKSYFTTINQNENNLKVDLRLYLTSKDTILCIVATDLIGRPVNGIMVNEKGAINCMLSKVAD